jgi:hypothetical protein
MREQIKKNLETISRLFAKKEYKKFFKDENERNLWVKLNAEHIRYGNKMVNYKNEQDLGDVNKLYSPMWVSNNQLTYDEYMCDAPRISFEEFLTLSDAQLLYLVQERNRQKIKEMFEEIDEEL